MNKKIKTAIVILLLICISFVPVTAFAHSGRTDSAGGHHDYNNKSGLGSYHYHHGYGPHLHPNGECPYDSKPSYDSKPTYKPAASTSIVKTNPNAKKAVITSSNVKINGNVVNNATLKYPLISHNNITYFPLTYRNKVSLGLTSETKNGAIYFTTGNAASYTSDISGSSIKGKNITATKLYYSVYINGTKYSYDSSWPLLKYNDIVYIPMTYGFAQALGLEISWTQETGLAVSSQSASTPITTQSMKQSVSKIQTQTKPTPQTFQLSEPVIQFQPIDPSARPVLNKNAIYYVYSLESNSKYLGKISSDLYSIDSIFNMTGFYGKYSSQTSIWNTTTRYGSLDGIYSARNVNAQYPPVIVDTKGNAVGFLTSNSNINLPAIPSYSPSELLRIFS